MVKKKEVTTGYCEQARILERTAISLSKTGLARWNGNTILAQIRG